MSLSDSLDAGLPLPASPSIDFSTIPKGYILNSLLQQPSLFDLTVDQPPPPALCPGIEEELQAFNEFGTGTIIDFTGANTPDGGAIQVPTYINEFWTGRQRAAHSLHEISYRACFKPQLPRFFIERLTRPRDIVYDPFMGRGTTLLEAALLGRVPAGCDINPLSAMLLLPRLSPPEIEDVAERLQSIPLDRPGDWAEELLVFYHPETLKAIASLKAYLLERDAAGTLDRVDSWIRMVAVNRLSGHSPGFFSVYTLPPNQAVSLDRQKLINAKLSQTPSFRDIRALILRKTRSLLKDPIPAAMPLIDPAAPSPILLTGPSAHTLSIPSDSISLVVTSPPFLDVVDYAGDNWLRCWFCGIDAQAISITMARRLEDWMAAMTEVFHELYRVVRPGGHVAFEVGEVQRGKVRLEESVIPCGMAAGLTPQLVLINAQEFTKTANCWGVNNGSKGTNTNRIVLFRK